ncbi:MAG: twin-arginine translocation signal domain-containing protein, partial [Maioricimonas sp. JB049]
MNHLSRRDFLQSTAALAAASGLSGWTAGLLQAETETTSELWMAPFRFDVSPPLGHPCCGGCIPRVVGYDDPLEAMGFVVKGAGKPIVICSVD